MSNPQQADPKFFSEIIVIKTTGNHLVKLVEKALSIVHIKEFFDMNGIGYDPVYKKPELLDSLKDFLKSNGQVNPPESKQNLTVEQIKEANAKVNKLFKYHQTKIQNIFMERWKNSTAYVKKLKERRKRFFYRFIKSDLSVVHPVKKLKREYFVDCLKMYKEMHYILKLARYLYTSLAYHDQYKEEHFQNMLVESFKSYAIHRPSPLTKMFSNPQKETQQLVWASLMEGQPDKPVDMSNREAQQSGYYQLTHKRTDICVHRWLLELKATDHPLKPKEESQVKNYLQLQSDYDLGLLINFRTSMQSESIDWKIFYHKC